MKNHLMHLLLGLSFLLSARSEDRRTPTVTTEDFSILIVRGAVKNGLLYDQLFLDNQLIGNCYENDALKIPIGTYKGLIRYRSEHNFVGSGLGQLATEGDFLLEVSGVPGRTDILFHGGVKPRNSKGCILLGPVNKEPDGSAMVGKDHPLYILRVKFYGSEFPVSCPDKNIVIEIK
jgi:hypothetical protein